MPRRIEVELTSERGDGTWTWRAAGARQPKGSLDASLLFDGAKVGDIVRADVEFDLDGIGIVAVLPPREARTEPNRIELISAPPKDDQLVTTTLAPRGRSDRPRRPREDRAPGERTDRRRQARSERGREDNGTTSRGSGERRQQRREDGGRRSETTGEASGRPPRSTRSSRAAAEAKPKPKPKRLRPRRVHRDAVIAELPEAERPIAEQLLRGGIPAVRQAIEKQNADLVAEGQPPVKTEALLAIAERLAPKLRSAEWRDRAEAALAGIDEIDLRDLRSVVVASDGAARGEEGRELAATLRDGLTRRVEAEHQAWLDELASTIGEGRAIRALRLSSRPPKAGAPLPPDLAAKLVSIAEESLTVDASHQRWAMVLDAVAFSPVRQAVRPAELPTEPSAELLTALRKLAGRIPEIAARFGVSTPDARKAPKPETAAETAEVQPEDGA